MNDPPLHPLEAILRFCAETAPKPWYPSEFARHNGIDRNSLDPHLDQLRLGGLISITDWQQGSGQGYALTPAGREALENPKHLAQLQAGALPASADGRTAAEAVAPGMTSWDRGETVRSAVYWRGRPVVMRLLLGANIAVFLAGLYLTKVAHVPEGRALHQTGAVVGIDILKGDWFRLLTCCFVHANGIHLAMNMYALYVAGQVAEAMWGRVRFLALYLIAGFGSSCVALAYQPVGLVGASGALCGVLAGEGVWIVLNRRHLDRRLVSSWLQNLMINAILIAIIGYTVPRVSNSAHLGGAVIGAVSGLFLNFQRFFPGWRRWAALVGLLVIPPLCLGALHYGMTRNGQWLEMGYLPLIHSDEVTAGQALEQADKVTAVEPADRKTDAVQAAVAGLEAARGKLSDWTVQLSRLGPYRDADYEKARQVRQRHLQELAKLLDLAEQRLRRGADWTEAEEGALRGQAEMERKTRREWQVLLQ